jgi:hypothetical protein
MVLASLISCGPLKEVETEHTTTHVTVWTESYPMEVSIDFPDIYQQVMVRDSNSHLENQYAISDASIDRWGFLHHTLATIPQEIHTEVEVPVQHRDSIVYKDREVYKERPVPRELTWWQKFWISAGKSLSALALLIVLFYALRLIRRPP